MHARHKDIAILYHGGCPDGLGGAYAAWKKFGDEAEYIPVKHGLPAPEDLAGRTLYLIDFCYPKDIMDTLLAQAKSLTVLDHHLGIRNVVETMPAYVFDANRSGATIAWNYFHPDTPVPALLSYIEDGDLYRFSLPDSRQILAYFYTTPLLGAPFEDWDPLVRMLDDPAKRIRIVETGTLFEQHHAHIVERAVNHAELVRFEGYECYFACTTGEFVSDVGHRLVMKKPPIALIASVDADGLRVSLRSDKSVSVAVLAQKYGGNGHPAAAGFRIPFGVKVPWELVQDHENPRH